uniref:Reelin domain-containing protein n=1 Tax=Parastrongyloides trichosuri TaxID=131310 RepID=A0A0N4ZAE9_PARTI
MTNKYILFTTIFVVLLSRDLVESQTLLRQLLRGEFLFRRPSNEHGKPMNFSEGKTVILKGQFKCNGTDYGHVNVTLKDGSDIKKPGTKLRIGDEGNVHWNWQDESKSFIPYLNISHNCTKPNEHSNCWKSFVLNFTDISPKPSGNQKTPMFDFGNKELTRQNDTDNCKKIDTNNRISNQPAGAGVLRHTFDASP